MKPQVFEGLAQVGDCITWPETVRFGLRHEISVICIKLGHTNKQDFNLIEALFFRIIR